jgi:ABC-2 type transport system permease protein
MNPVLMKLSNIFCRRNRILLRELVVTDFKLRYQGSALGYLWSLLKPLMLFAILYVVFVKFLRFGDGIEHFPVYLLLGIVIWGFFVESTVQGMQAIVSRGDLIRKINFPKYIIVISGTISALINLAINLVVVMLFAAINGVDINISAFLALFYLLELYVFTLSIAFLLGAMYVKYRDISYIWEVFLQGAFYATPILYPLSMVISYNPTIAQFLLVNPVAQIIQDLRFVLISDKAERLVDINTIAYLPLAPYLIVIAFVVFGAYYFKKNSKYFAEKV